MQNTHKIKINKFKNYNNLFLKFKKNNKKVLAYAKTKKRIT